MLVPVAVGAPDSRATNPVTDFDTMTTVKTKGLMTDKEIEGTTAKLTGNTTETSVCPTSTLTLPSTTDVMVALAAATGGAGTGGTCGEAARGTPAAGKYVQSKFRMA